MTGLEVEDPAQASGPAAAAAEDLAAGDELEHHVNVLIVLEGAEQVDDVRVLDQAQNFDFRLDVLCLVELDDALLRLHLQDAVFACRSVEAELDVRK